MSRKRRSRTSLQTAAIAAVCVLFVCVTLVGLYRCISQPLTLPDEGPGGGPGRGPLRPGGGRRPGGGQRAEGGLLHHPGGGPGR